MDLAGELNVLEELAGNVGMELDPAFARLALRDAESEFPGDSEAAAFQRLEQAAGDCGLRLAVFERRLSHALDLVAAGTAVVVRERAGGRWLVLRGKRRGRLRVFVSDLGVEQRLTSAELAGRLGVSGQDDLLPWAVVAPHASGEATADEHAGDGHHGGHPTPLRRLFRMIKPEGRDLRAVVAFAVAVGVLSLATPIAVEALVSSVAFGRLLQPIVVLALVLMTCLSMAAVLRTMQVYLVELLQRRVFVRVVAELAQLLPRVDQAALDRRYGPELVNRFFDVLIVQKAGALLLLDGLALVLQTCIGLIVLAFYHPLLLGFDAVVVAAIAFTVVLLGRGAVATSIEESRAKYDVAGCLEEVARAPLAYRLGGASSYALDRADGASRRYLHARERHFAIVQRQSIFAMGFQAVASTAMLGLGGWLVISGQLTLGQLVAAELIVATVAGSFAKVGKHLEAYYDLLAAVEKIGLLLDLPAERAPSAGLAAVVDREVNTARPAGVRFRRVGYTHDDGRSAFRDLDLDVAPGERLTICGPSGSGKSLVGDLLFGLREPTSGQIELDGIDLRDLRPEALRRHVALVQGDEVIEATIAENVRMGRDHVGMADVRRALKVAGLVDEISELPDGLQTRLSPTGFPLSHGQTSRLMIARAVAGSPRLLVLDGCLDNMEPRVRRRVAEALFDPQAPWTLIVLTHDPETLRDNHRSFALSDDTSTTPGDSRPKPLPPPDSFRMVV